MSEEVYWMNVDVPTQKCTIHRIGCEHELRKYETNKKGIEKIKENGGWLSFQSLPAAEMHYRNHYQQRNYALSLRCRCLTQETGS